LLYFALGSPFKVPVEDKIDPSKVRMHGSGLNPEGVRATQPAVFTIDCTDAGKAPLKAVVDDGMCRVNYDAVSLSVARVIIVLCGCA